LIPLFGQAGATYKCGYGATSQEGFLFMNREYSCVLKQKGDWWIGRIEEIPGVNCQERTREELIESLKVTLKEALEFNSQDATYN
jgi:predicted RNase H-like HicB family nuclease